MCLDNPRPCVKPPGLKWYQAEPLLARPELLPFAEHEPAMSLVSFRLNPSSLLSEVLKAVKPGRGTLPSGLVEDLQSLNSFDLYMKNLQLTPSNVIATTDFYDAAALSKQVLYGIRDNSPDTAAAMYFWAGLLSMRTRSVRFTATKLLLGVLDEFIKMIEDPTSCSTDTGVVADIVKELWQRFLVDSHRDVNGYQRSTVLKYISDWSLRCPELFWTRETSTTIGSCLEDTQDSVRKEAMRQARRVVIDMDPHTVGAVPLNWRRTLMAYAEYDTVGGSVNRRTALELLTYVSPPALTWCVAVIKNCVEVREPPATVAFAMRLVWTIPAQNLAETVLALGFRDEASASLLGRTFAGFRPNHAWDELSHAIGVHSLPPTSIKFLLDILLAFGTAVAAPRILQLVRELVRHHESYLRYAAWLLKDVSEVDSVYFALVDELVERSVDEVASVIEQWTEAELREGGFFVVNKPRDEVPAAFAGLVYGDTRYMLASRARDLVKLVDTPEFGRSFASFLEDIDVQIELCELEIVAKCLAQLFTTFKLHSRGDALQINPTGIYASLNALSEPLNDREQEILMNIMILEKLHVFDTESLETSVAERFPSSRAANTDFVAGGAAL